MHLEEMNYVSFIVLNLKLIVHKCIDGYGFCHIPTSPGNFDLEIVTWRPVGTASEEFRSKTNLL